MAASSNAGGRPGMPNGAAALMGGVAAYGGVPGSMSMNGGGQLGGGAAYGVPSSLSINGGGMLGSAAYSGSVAGSVSIGGGQLSKGAMQLIQGFAPDSMSGQVGSGLAGMPPAMPGTIASMPFGSSGRGNTAFCTSAYGLGSTQPTLGAPGLPVTPAYERAAAAMGGPGEGLMNPFEAGNFEARYATGLPPMDYSSYPEAFGNPESMPQTLQALEANGQAPSDGFSAPWASQYPSMTASKFAGSSKTGGAFDSGPPQNYGGLNGAGGFETVSSLAGAPSQPYGQTAGGALDGRPDYIGAAAKSAAVNGSGYDAMAAYGKPPQDAGGYSFPTAGSFVATPYDDEGLPAYDAQPESGMGPPSSNAKGSRSVAPYQGEVRTGATNAYESYMEGDAKGSRSVAPYQGEVRPGVTNAYESYMEGARSYGGAANGYDNYMGARPAPPPGYDSYMGGIGKGSANAYDGSAGSNWNGLSDYRGTSDYGASQLYGKGGASYSGVPPPGNASYASIDSPAPDGRQGGSLLQTSGSFVAAPYAEGAPAFDALSQKNPMTPMPYSPPPPMPYSPPPQQFNSLQTSGSFVASPFADGAPTPDMFGMSMNPRANGAPSPDMFGMSMAPRMPSSYPDSAYGSLPSSSMGMGMYGGGAPSSLYGGGAPSSALGMGMGMGGGPGAWPSLAGGPGPSSFVGFDTEVPGGSSLGAGNFGSMLGPQSGSFVAPLPPSTGKDGSSGGAGVRFSDMKNDHPGTDAQNSNGRPNIEKPGRGADPADPHSKARMSRGSRAERDGAAPTRTKRKVEKRACC